MAPIRIDRPDPRFLVFRNGMLGNTIVAEPFVRALKALWPACSVSLVVDAVGLGLLRTHPQVDAFFLFDKHKHGLAAQWDLVRAWRARRFDASFHLRTGVRNELLAFLSGIPQRVGSRLRGSFQFLTHVQPKRDDRHVLTALSEFASEALGRTVVLDAPRLYPDPEAGALAEAFLAGHGLAPGGYLVMHLGGRTWHGLEWGPAAFQPILALARERLKLGVVLVGTPDEAQAVARVFPPGPGVAHAFGSPMAVTSELIRRAAAFLGNDSGPAHVAEAWGLPKAVAYYNDPAALARWRPLAQARSLVLFREEFTDPGLPERVADWLGERLEGRAQRHER